MIEPQSIKHKITFQGRMVKDIEILLNVNPMLLKTNVKRFKFPDYEGVPYTHEIIYIVRDWENDQSMELRHTPYFEYGVGDQEFHPYVDWTSKQKSEAYKEIRVFVDKEFLNILWIENKLNSTIDIEKDFKNENIIRSKLIPVHRIQSIDTDVYV
jgi:hypothetical protein